ncbi:MAG TPA: hypothetical protein VHS31_12985 [Tepidisphaeraceae bacterium]|jgi:hypothetical protein|nr:hypothetical protein [Tepidisphaeraceae bacterium]
MKKRIGMSLLYHFFNRGLFFLGPAAGKFRRLAALCDFGPLEFIQYQKRFRG